ncbi:unnamed protein product [Prorocentrum cordatum]|uniref:Kinesin-like protein n=1 Tax=Prorocentrum cordatum TaxID=2364126 RepID=A0ABN9X7Z9_9DINO|nr:unnamed protein product [Polarella glacialis]
METLAEALELFNLGARRRAVGTTQMNAASSRSHAVFSVQVRMAAPAAGGVVESQAKVHFVDLAGSEKQKKTGASGARLKEGIGINQSLTTLGRVISDLSKPGSTSHVPFRDSKLTLLLRDALMGNSRTGLLACVSPSRFNLEESVSTLEFAARCKLVQTSAHKNEQSRVDILKKLEAEKDAIESQLQQERSKSEELCRKLQLELEAAERRQHVAELALQERGQAEEQLRELRDLREQHRAEQSESARVLREKEELLAQAEQDRASLLREREQLLLQPRSPSPDGDDAFGQKGADAEELRELMEEERRKQQERERELHTQMQALRNVQESLDLDQSQIEAKRQEQRLSLEAERARLGILGGVDLAVVADAPRLVNLHPDPSLKGCLVYHLPVGETTVGSDAERCQVRLSGLGVGSAVCVLDNADNEQLVVRPAEEGLVRVNGAAVPTGSEERLRDGDRLAVGRAYIFQVHIPLAARDSSGPSHEAEVDFERAMDEIWAGAEVESCVQRAALIVRSDLGTDAANRLLADARRASEEIAQANLLLTEMPAGWTDGVRRYELAVVFGSEGPPRVCVAARRGPAGPADPGAGAAAGIWELDAFREEPSVLLLAVNLDSRAAGPRPQDWEARTWSEVSVEDYKALAARLEAAERSLGDLLAQAAQVQRGGSGPSTGSVAKLLVPKTVRRQLSSVKHALRDIGTGSPGQEGAFAPPPRRRDLDAVRPSMAEGLPPFPEPGGAAPAPAPRSPRSWNTGLRAVGHGLRPPRQQGATYEQGLCHMAAIASACLPSLSGQAAALSSAGSVRKPCRYARDGDAAATLPTQAAHGRMAGPGAAAGEQVLPAWIRVGSKCQYFSEA